MKKSSKGKIKNRNLVISVMLLALPILWVSTGSVARFTVTEIPHQEDGGSKKQDVFYKTNKSISYEIFDNITLYGVAAADRETTILSELDGRISEVFVKEGDEVEEEELLIRLDERQYKAALEKAESHFEMEKINLAATKTLYKKKLTSVANLARDKAKFADAKSLFETAINHFDNIEIRAPFSGRVESIYVDKGEVIKKYDSKMLDFINDQKIVIRAYVPENRVLEIKLGSTVNIQISTGYVYVGKVSYISGIADVETRTYLIEVETDNQNNLIKSGMTAELKIPTLLVRVHKINSSALSISDSGVVGMKYINESGIVSFAEVKIIKESGKEMLVTGLPDKVRVIVSGQGFITVGKKFEELYD